jgi:hypothetical protein
MNFGHKITIAYSLFVALIITMVTLCIKKKDMFLVSSDYYKKELAYQDEIDKYDNASKLLVPVKISKESGNVLIRFPKEQIGSTGEIHFYRPSNANLDFKLPVNIAKDSTQSVDVSKLVGGLWVVKLEWSKDGTQYLKEEKLVL